MMGLLPYIFLIITGIVTRYGVDLESVDQELGSVSAYFAVAFSRRQSIGLGKERPPQLC
jgi:hypothetical protein